MWGEHNQVLKDELRIMNHSTKDKYLGISENMQFVRGRDRIIQEKFYHGLTTVYYGAQICLKQILT